MISILSISRTMYYIVVSSVFRPPSSGICVMFLTPTLKESFDVPGARYQISYVRRVSIRFFFVYRYCIELDSDMDIRYRIITTTTGAAAAACVCVLERRPKACTGGGNEGKTPMAPRRLDQKVYRWGGRRKYRVKSVEFAQMGVRSFFIDRFFQNGKGGLPTPINKGGVFGKIYQC